MASNLDRGGRRSRVIAVAVLASLLGTMAIVGPASANTLTTIAITPGKATYERGETVVISFSVTPAPPVGGCGYVRMWETTTGTDESRGEYYICNPTGIGSYFEWTQEPFAVGTHTFKATFDGWGSGYDPSESDESSIEIIRAASTTHLFNVGDPPEAHNPIRLAAVVTAYKPQSGGTVSFFRVGVAGAICTIAITTNIEQKECFAPALPVGSYTFRAIYSGSTDIAGSTSSDFQLSVIPDTVHARNVGLQLGIFYPYKDNYRDTVAIRGTRDEPISVTIRIYNPAGSLILTQTIAQGLGSYSWAWGGRYSSGVIRPEGKYKVVQTLKDAAGTTKSYTGYVVLSKKKLYRYSKTLSKLGSSADAKGQIGGLVTFNTSAGFAKIYAAPESNSWAGAGWEFTLPSATVYESFYVRIYGRRSGGPGVNRLGAQQFSRCSYSSTGAWNESCFSQWVTIPATSGTTLYYYRTANLPSDYRSAGRKVRLTVNTTGGTIWVYKAQVIVKYGILKY